MAGGVQTHMGSLQDTYAYKPMVINMVGRWIRHKVVSVMIGSVETTNLCSLGEPSSGLTNIMLTNHTHTQLNALRLSGNLHLHLTSMSI